MRRKNVVSGTPWEDVWATLGWYASGPPFTSPGPPRPTRKRRSRRDQPPLRAGGAGFEESRGGATKGGTHFEGVVRTRIYVTRVGTKDQLSTRWRPYRFSSRLARGSAIGLVA
jgi:hypothetical protein